MKSIRHVRDGLVPALAFGRNAGAGAGSAGAGFLRACPRGPIELQAAGALSPGCLRAPAGGAGRVGPATAAASSAPALERIR